MERGAERGQVPRAVSTSSTFASDITYSYPVDNQTTLTGLTPGRTYYVKVRALESKNDVDGNPYLLTAYSSAATMTTSTTFTAAPPPVTVTSVAKDTIVVEWDVVDGADGYRVQTTYGSTKRYLNSYAIPAGAASFQTSAGKVSVTLKKFCDSNGTCSAFVPGKSYLFRVTAMAGSTRISDYTTKGASVVASALPVSAPTDFTLKGTTSGSLTLSWQRVAGAASYRIQQKKGSTSGETRYLYNVCGSGSPVTCTYDGDTISVTLTSSPPTRQGSRRS